MLPNAAYVVSAKFAPGLMKEFGLLGDSLARRGVHVRYLLAGRYESMGWDRPDTHYVAAPSGRGNIVLDTIRWMSGKKVDQLFAESPPVVLYFYNTHPLNPLLAGMVKRRFSRASVIVHLHDPFKPDKAPYGRKGAWRIRIVEFVQKLTAMQADHAVFPSEYSLALFRTHYKRFSGGTHVAPLLIPDRSDDPVRPRIWFSMVGRMQRATGHETFRDLVNHVAEKSLGYKFALVCCDDLSRYLSKVTAPGRRLLTVINKPVIEDSVIDMVVKRSYATFRLATEVTQSGVVPVAYMNRTPVIVRDIPGLHQHVRHKHDGYLVPADCLPVHLLEAMEHVKTNFARLSDNARHSYEETWSEANWDSCYGWLMQLLEGHETAPAKPQDRRVAIRGCAVSSVPDPGRRGEDPLLRH